MNLFCWQIVCVRAVAFYSKFNQREHVFKYLISMIESEWLLAFAACCSSFLSRSTWSPIVGGWFSTFSSILVSNSAVRLPEGRQSSWSEQQVLLTNELTWAPLSTVASSSDYFSSLVKEDDIRDLDVCNSKFIFSRYTSLAEKKFIVHKMHHQPDLLHVLLVN